VPKFTRWLSLMASSAALCAPGCSSTTTGNGASTSTAWHWPWTSPAAPAVALASTSDPTSLAAKPPKPGPDLYVATARMYEKNGDAGAAAVQYQKALDADPNNLPALLGVAALHDRQREFGDADKTYQEAIKRHPKDAAVFNDRGLSYQRRGHFDDAARSLAKAIELQPDKPLYRNNMATVLVAMHRPDQALAQLTAVHGPAVAHYNLAILLHRNGNDHEAQYHFAQAAQIDPSLVAAREWAERLSPNSRPPVVAMEEQIPAARPPIENMPIPPRRPIIVSASPGDMAEGPALGGVPQEASIGRGFAQPSLVPQQQPVGLQQPTFAQPQPRFAPPQPTLAPPRPQVSLAQLPNPGMRYPQHAPVAVADGAIPPSPDRLYEVPAVGDGLRPLPPVQ
jgi:Tfp pilus assembly protein PilF